MVIPLHIMTFMLSVLFFSVIPYSLSHQNDANAIVQAIAGSVLLLYTIVLKTDLTRKKDFENWLAEQRKYGEFALVGSEYNGAFIDGNTEFVQFEVCLSFAFLSYSRKTHYYIKGHHPVFLYNILFTAFSLLFGWWSIPWGPFRTIKAIGFNLRARTKRLEDVMRELE